MPKELPERCDEIDRHTADLHVGDRGFHMARNHLGCSAVTVTVHNG